jgi:hypothetical protein
MKTKRSRPLPHIVLVVLLVLAATFAATASASAATYCVHDPACPAGGVAKATLGQAIETTDEDAVPDTIRVGPGRFPMSNVSALKPVSIVGSGMGETEFEAKAGEVGALMYLTAGCRASDLTLRLTGNGEYGMRLSGGADAESTSGPAFRATRSATVAARRSKTRA